MAAISVGSSTGPPKLKKKMRIARELREIANLIIKSKQNSNKLCDILELFNKQAGNYTPLLLTVELIFTTILRRGDMVATSLEQCSRKTPEEIYARWLRQTYEVAFSRVRDCVVKGEEPSRVQAMVTSLNLFRDECVNPTALWGGKVQFRHNRMWTILGLLLNRDQSQSALINRFMEYTEYRDVQQCGLKMLFIVGQKAKITDAYMQNYLELFDVLVRPGFPNTPREEDVRCDEDKYLIEKDGVAPYIFNPTKCKNYINHAWSQCLKWPLRAAESTHRRALVLLVDRIMPYLRRPELVTDFIFDSLDSGPALSMIALRGMQELVTKHKIEYPDLYDKLYAMFEPEMFATRSRKRLIDNTDHFLSSTHLSASLVAAFAKRFSRLAVMAAPEDAIGLLQLVSNLIQRHPSLQRMVCHDQPAIMPKDPYVVEETSAEASQAMQSSLWEVSALKQHFTPEVSAAAAKLLAAAEPKPPPLPPPVPAQQQFELECKKRFKTISMNFVRVTPDYCVSRGDMVHLIWDMDKGIIKV